MRTARPGLLQVACFDTAFHHGLPRLAALTALPRGFFDEGVRRYGFHGLSYEYVVEALRDEGAVVAGIAMGLAVPVVLISRADPAPARLASLALAALVHHRTQRMPVQKTTVESSLQCAPQPEHARCPLPG